MLLSLAAPAAAIIVTCLICATGYTVLAGCCITAGYLSSGHQALVVVEASQAADGDCYDFTSSLRTLTGLQVWQPGQMQGTIAFFHPYASGGGGGERVLWMAVAALQTAAPSYKIVILTGAGLNPEQLLQEVKSKFNIAISSRLQVVPLTQVDLLRPEQYPRWTLLAQAWGSVRLAFEALTQCRPEVFIDSTGLAGTLPLARLAGCQTAAYVHYPMVSADMLRRVRQRQAAFNNSVQVAGSLARSVAKAIYYYCVAALYGAAGACAQVVMVNSSWTADHIRQLWWRRSGPVIVFPPCNTEDYQELPLDRKLKKLYLVSLAQFRPEKDHALQVQAFALARQRAAAMGGASGSAVLDASLKLIGSCRDSSDQHRVEALQQLARDLGLQDCIEFCVNVDYGELRGLLAGAVGGLHTMVDEHFGISVVEYMAAGMVPIANDSGGPRADIVVPEATPEGSQPTGYLCTSVGDYAEAIIELLCMDQRQRMVIAAAARRRAARFSDQRFQHAFVRAMQPLLQSTACRLAPP